MQPLFLPNKLTRILNWETTWIWKRANRQIQLNISDKVQQMFMLIKNKKRLKSQHQWQGFDLYAITISAHERGFQVCDGQISLQKQEDRQQTIQRRINNFTEVLALIRSLRRQFRGSPAESFWRSSYWISLMSLQTCCNLWKRNKHISKHRNTYKKNHDKKKMLLHTALLHESLKKKKS